MPGGLPGGTEIKTGERLKAAIQRACQLRVQAKSYSQIAEILVKEGYAETCSSVQAYNYVTGEIRRRSKEEKETTNDARRVELERLDRMMDVITERVEGGSLDHMEMALKIMSRRSKLLGLDSPVKVETTVKDDRKALSDAELYQRTRELAERLERAGFKRMPILDEVSPFVEGEVVGKSKVKSLARPEEVDQPGKPG